MVGHQAVRVTEPVEAIADLMNKFEECDPIGVIKKHTLSFISSTGDVIDSTWVLDP